MVGTLNPCWAHVFGNTTLPSGPASREAPSGPASNRSTVNALPAVRTQRSPCGSCLHRFSDGGFPVFCESFNSHLWRWRLLGHHAGDHGPPATTTAGERAPSAHGSTHGHPPATHHGAHHLVRHGAASAPTAGHAAPAHATPLHSILGLSAPCVHGEPGARLAGPDRPCLAQQGVSGSSAHQAWVRQVHCRAWHAISCCCFSGSLLPAGLGAGGTLHSSPSSSRWGARGSQSPCRGRPARGAAPCPCPSPSAPAS